MIDGRALAVVVVSLVIGTACHEAGRLDPAMVTVALRTAPNTLDPRQVSDEASQRVADLVFSPLLIRGADLRPVPHLAERFEQIDPLTYVAYLRKGVRFHDGGELTSADVVYTYGAFLDPAFVSPLKGAFSSLASVTALDAYTVRFGLKSAFGGFPNQLASAPPVVPVGSGDSLKRRPIGTGPYRFVESVDDDHVTLAAFDGYFGGRPRNAGLVLRVIPDDTMRGLELRRGSVDLVVNDVPPDIVHQLRGDARLAVVTAPGLDLAYLGINLTDPVLRDTRVRQALAHAIDRQAIVEHLRRGLAQRATGLVPPQVWAYEPNVQRFDYDPARAAALLDEAGFTDPDGPGPRPRFRLRLSSSTNEETRLQCAIIQHDLRQIGIDVEVRSYEFATFFEDVVRGRFQLYALQWTAGSLADPDILRRVFHSSQVPPSGFNRGGYRSVEVDRWLELADAAPTLEEQRRFYAAAQRQIAVDVPYVPLWNKTNVLVVQRTLDGVRLDALGDFLPLRHVRRVEPRR